MEWVGAAHEPVRIVVTGACAALRLTGAILALMRAAPGGIQPAAWTSKDRPRRSRQDDALTRHKEQVSCGGRGRGYPTNTWKQGTTGSLHADVEAGDLAMPLERP